MRMARVSRPVLQSRNEHGFTLIELVMAMGAAAIVMSAATYSIFEVLNTNTRNTVSMTAVRNVQSAGFWVTREAEMAFSANVSADHDSVTLRWFDPYDPTAPNDTSRSVLNACTYTLATYADNGKTRLRLLRSLQVGNQDPAVTSIAEHFDNRLDGPFDTAVSGFDYDENGRKLALTVTAKVTSHGITSTESRIYEAVLRPAPQ